MGVTAGRRCKLRLWLEVADGAEKHRDRPMDQPVPKHENDSPPVAVSLESDAVSAQAKAARSDEPAYASVPIAQAPTGEWESLG